MATPGRPGPDRLATPFLRVLCAVDGSRGSAEAVRQALALVHPAGTVGFIAIETRVALGRIKRDAQAAAHDAVRIASAGGHAATACVLTARSAGAPIVRAAAGFDLLVIGAHHRSRDAGMLLGSTASMAVHVAPCPVLVARALPATGFPGTVVVATDGPADLAACQVGAEIAAAHRGSVILAHAGDAGETTLGALAAQRETVARITGRIPAILSGPGDPAQRIPAAALSAAAGLIVLGRPSRRGAHAVSSVSDRVAHRAPCSALILRHR